MRGSGEAAHVASLTSVLRPGTFLMCRAVARTNVNVSSSRCQTGFQYTPVASIATCVQPCAVSQSDRASTAVVVVPTAATTCSVSPLARAMHAQATTLSLCTSSPAQRGDRSSITTYSLVPGLHHA